MIWPKPINSNINMVPITDHVTCLSSVSAHSLLFSVSEKRRLHIRFQFLFGTIYLPLCSISWSFKHSFPYHVY